MNSVYWNSNGNKYKQTRYTFHKDNTNYNVELLLFMVCYNKKKNVLNTNNIRFW